MTNDMPEDDKTIIGGGATQPPESPEPSQDDPFVADDSVTIPPEPVFPASEEPVPAVDEVLDTPGMAAEAMPDAVDPELEPEAPAEADEPEEAVAPPEDRTEIAPPPAAAVDDDKTALVGADGDRTVMAETRAADAPPAAPLPSSAPLNPNDPVPVGTIINNNYEVKELISAGGMGEVFRGANTFTGDAVAIKIVLQSLANDPKIAALFMREAKVLCGLSDQAIVRYYNFVRDADLDRFCLIMEFIDGVSLSDFVRQERPLTSAEARNLMRKVAAGLQRAHDMDVIHRDLSPDNVMLRDGDVARPVLIDFGIAKSTEMAENTLHGQLAGKFKYISPEQLGHFGGDIGPRTDIYGLGLLIAAALRGEPIDMGSSVVEAVNARSKIPSLDGVPEDMRPILSYMLEPNPADRPAHMSDLIALLDHAQPLPAAYTGGAEWSVPSAEEDRTIIAATPSMPQGLRQPPGSAPATATGLGTAPGFGAPGTEASASPFGATTAVPPGQLAGGLTAPPGTGIPGLSVPPMTQPPQTTLPPTSIAPRRRASREGGGFGGFLRWVLVLVAIAGLGGFVAYRQGLLPESLTGVAPPENGTGAQTDQPVADADGGTITRADFLASYVEDGCGYAERVAAGPNTGTIDGFTATAGTFDGLLGEFETLFGSRPALRERIVTQEQCAVLDLARSVARSEGTPPVLTLDSDRMASGGSIVGRLSDRRGRPVWLALVTTAGGVYNLTDRLSEQADGSATFSFGLNASGAGGAEPQLILAVVSDLSLTTAAAATNGARASSLLPLIEAEIARLDGKAGATVAYFDLVP